MPNQTTIDARMANLGWTGRPVDHIVNQVGHPLAGIDNKSQLWEDLNENVCRHARANNWAWIPLNGNNGDRQYVGPLRPNGPFARPTAGTLGIPLLDGTNNALSCNCGVFNTVVRQIAWHILGFQDNEIAAAFTDKTFVTLPGSATARSFDAAWTGNVRTVANDFHVIGAYKFTGHSFSKHPAGGFSDATCGVRQFAQKTDIFWFDAKSADLKVENRFFKVTTIYNQQNAMPPGGAPFFLIGADLLKTAADLFLPGGAGLTRGAIRNVPDMCATRVEWPNFWLLSIHDLTLDFLAWAKQYFSAL